MTGNIIVSTCCLGDMAVNAPSSSGCALGLGGGGGGGAFTAISPSQTCANYYMAGFAVAMSMAASPQDPKLAAIERWPDYTMTFLRHS